MLNSEELDGAGRVDAEADGDDGVEIVVLDLTGNLPCSFPPNYPEFPDNCMSHTKARRHEGEFWSASLFALLRVFVPSYETSSRFPPRMLVHTKTRSHEGLRAVDDALAAVFECWRTEIDQKAQGKVEKPEVG